MHRDLIIAGCDRLPQGHDELFLGAGDLKRHLLQQRMRQFFEMSLLMKEIFVF